MVLPVMISPAAFVSADVGDVQKILVGFGVLLSSVGSPTWFILALFCDDDELFNGSGLAFDFDVVGNFLDVGVNVAEFALILGVIEFASRPLEFVPAIVANRRVIRDDVPAVGTLFDRGRFFYVVARFERPIVIEVG